MGKTSFMHQVQWYLTADCPQQSDTEKKKARAAHDTTDHNYSRRMQIVWFDAWRHQNDDPPIVALLHEMRAQFGLAKRISSKLKTYTSVAAQGALLILDEQTKRIGLQCSRLRDENRARKEANLETELPSYALRRHLRDAINALLPRPRDGSDPRLVVFVDDVDRCEPEVAYNLLEGLKIYLSLDNCVFILGMNEKAVASAIGKRLQVLSDTQITQVRAAAYMEKLCHNVWRLPAIRNPVDVLCEMLSNDLAKRWIRMAIEPIGICCLPPNPRRLKGLANLIERLWPKLPNFDPPADDKQGVYETSRLLVVAYVYQFHHDLYARWSHDIDLYNLLRDWCDGNRAEHSFLEAMILPSKTVADDDERSPTPTFAIKSNFPDPSEANVFWIQPLIQTLGTEAEPTQFQRYLHEE